MSNSPAQKDKRSFDYVIEATSISQVIGMMQRTTLIGGDPIEVFGPEYQVYDVAITITAPGDTTPPTGVAKLICRLVYPNNSLGEFSLHLDALPPPRTSAPHTVRCYLPALSVWGYNTNANLSVHLETNAGDPLAVAHSGIVLTRKEIIPASS